MDRIWGLTFSSRLKVTPAWHLVPCACRWTAARRPWVNGLDIESGDLNISICLPDKTVRKIAAKFRSSEFLLSAKRSCNVKEPHPHALLDCSSEHSYFRAKLPKNTMGHLQGTPGHVMCPEATSRGRARLENVHCWQGNLAFSNSTSRKGITLEIIIISEFTKQLPCTRYCAKCFTCTISFNPSSSYKVGSVSIPTSYMLREVT